MKAGCVYYYITEEHSSWCTCQVELYTLFWKKTRHFEITNQYALTVPNALLIVRDNSVLPHDFTILQNTDAYNRQHIGKINIRSTDIMYYIYLYIYTFRWRMYNILTKLFVQLHMCDSTIFISFISKIVRKWINLISKCRSIKTHWEDV